MKRQNKMILSLLGLICFSTFAEGSLKVCVNTYLRGYPDNNFEVDSAINIFPEDVVKLLSNKVVRNPQNGTEMILIEHLGQELFAASKYIKESCFERNEETDHQVPTKSHLDRHQVDLSRPHSFGEQISGIAGNLLSPVKECRPCGRFKQRSSYFHPGEDLCTDEKGVAAYAIYTGIAVEVTDHCTDDFYEGKSWKNKSMNCKKSRGFGNRVMLMHMTNGKIWYSGYHHLGEVKVQKGDLVLPGEMIGTVGSTGVSFNYHLHFEIMDGTNPGSYNHVRNNPALYYKGGKMCESYYSQRRN
ncbi:MAG: M23 family metallopeptidase [Bacteriovoracaceae bacterium]|nr:M23 family metallopeptidase [Bacteriovoracaceae bacterium]